MSVNNAFNIKVEEDVLPINKAYQYRIYQFQYVFASEFR